MRVISKLCLSLMTVFWMANGVLVPVEQAFLTDLYNSLTNPPSSWQLNTLATSACSD